MTAAAIAKVMGRRVWDSRGRPTVEAEIHLVGGAIGRAIAPAGASTGSGEAVDLRDGGDRFGGQDVTRAVAHVEQLIAPALLGLDSMDQAAVDGRLIELDGTPEKRRLGGNATIAVSMAAAHAAAAATGQPLWRHLGGPDAATLPLPEIQIFGGGAHAAGRLDIQDFLIVCPGAGSFAQALDWTAEVLPRRRPFAGRAWAAQGGCRRGRLLARVSPTTRPRSRCSPEPSSGPGFARTSRWRSPWTLPPRSSAGMGATGWPGTGRELDTGGMIDLLLGWLDRYPIVSIEDPLAEDDPQGFVAFTRQVRDRCLVVGDDFLVSDAGRVRAAAHTGACSAVLLKPNQRGTLTRDQGGVGCRPGLWPDRHRLRAFGRERGHHHRPSRGRLGACRSSRSARSAARSGWPSGTKACGSRRRWASAPGSADARPWPS